MGCNCAEEAGTLIGNSAEPKSSGNSEKWPTVAINTKSFASNALSVAMNDSGTITIRIAYDFGTNICGVIKQFSRTQYWTMYLTQPFRERGNPT